MKFHFAPCYKNQEKNTPRYNSATQLAAPPTTTPHLPSSGTLSLQHAVLMGKRETKRARERDGVSSRVGGREGGGGVGKAALESRCQ